jgi:uncharacterized membrane protein (UPF0127 family)
VNLRRALRALAFAAVVGWVATLPACKNAGEQKPSADSGSAVAGPLSARVNVDVGGRWVTFRCELARTPAEHERGLMFRKELAPDAGMIFVFDRPFVQTFWMKNTLIPLDMVFIGADRRIVGIVENAEPETLTGRGVREPSQFVLEIGGGVAAKLGIRTGQRVELRGIDGF